MSANRIRIGSSFEVNGDYTYSSNFDEKFRGRFDIVGQSLLGDSLFVGSLEDRWGRSNVDGEMFLGADCDSFLKFNKRYVGKEEVIRYSFKNVNNIWVGKWEMYEPPKDNEVVDGSRLEDGEVDWEFVWGGDARLRLQQI